MRIFRTSSVKFVKYITEIYMSSFVINISKVPIKNIQYKYLQSNSLIY